MATYNEGDYMSVQELTETYNVKSSWVYDQIAAKKIAAYQLPGKRGMYLLKRDVAAFMQPRRVNPNGGTDQTA